jgi:hypothetical protein
MDLPQYPSLSPAANAALARGTDLPAPYQAFRFALAPGEAQCFDGLGNTVYVATATGELEISTSDGLDYKPWDTALGLTFARDHFYRRVWLRNPGGDAVTGILYTGFVTINDHRLHQVGETRLTLENQAGTAYESTALLAGTAWKPIAPAVTGRREVWLAVENAADPSAPAPAAWWRAGTQEDTRVPSHEIGLALDGITRLPLSDRVEVCTDAAPGAARVRYWLISYMDAGDDAIFGPPAPDERLVIPKMAAPDDYQGLTLSTNSNPADIWKLFDRDLSTEYICGNIGKSWWDLNIDLGAVTNITRLALVWNNTDVRDSASGPRYIRLLWSPDNASWPYAIGDNAGGACNQAVALGQTIYTKSWETGQLPARWLKIQVLRPWNRSAGATGFRLAALELYTKDPEIVSDPPAPGLPGITPPPDLPPQIITPSS